MAEGVVFDLGYRPHEGPRTGRRGARRALYRDGIRRVLGIRRRARRKLLPMALIGGALLPALFFVAIGVVVGEFDAALVLFGHPQYFDLTGQMALIFVALAAGELLIPDRSFGTLQVYASRPLTTVDYLLGRAAALATVAFSFLWLPHLVLYLGRAWVSAEGFASYAVAEADVLLTTAIASLAYLLAYTPLAFAVASVSRRPAIAAGAFLGVVTVSVPTATALTESGYSSLSLLALPHHPGYVKDWVMGASTNEWLPEVAGYGPAASLVMMATLAAACWLVVLFRQRKAL